MNSAQKLIAVLQESRDFLARSGNDFSWSSWEDAPSALAEIDNLISRLKSGGLPERSAIEVLFLPTGPIQEVSLSSGWGKDFLTLAARLDRAVNKVYGRDPRLIEGNKAAARERLKQGFDGRLRWFCLLFSATSIGYTTYLGLAHELPEIYFPIRLSGLQAWRVLVFACIFWTVLGIVNWISWFRKTRKK